MPRDPVTPEPGANEPGVLTSDISEIMLPNGAVYTFKDATARAGLAGAYVEKGTVATMSDLPASPETGWVYYVTAETKRYVWRDSTWEAFDDGGGGGSGGDYRTFYGTSGTAAATQAKTATITMEGSPQTGDLFLITFTNAQTYNGVPTLNINSTGAHNIRRVSGTNAARYEWSAGETLAMVFDGTYFVLTDGGIATTTYYGATKLATSATSTSGALALTPASLNSFALDMVSGAPVYSTSASYAVGDRVRYQYSTWECNTAIPTHESWNAAHWTELDPLQVQIDNMAADVEQYAEAAAQSAGEALQSASDADTYAESAQASAALAGIYAQEAKVLVISVPAFSSLPQTESDAGITADMVCVHAELGTPSAQTGTWTVTTSDGSVTVSGSINGSTSLKLYLMNQLT